MLIFGITGGSGSGKTSAGRIFGELGAQIIDTDIIARGVTRKGEACLDELSERFGKDILNEDGTLDRALLAEKAFSSPDKTKILNAVTHKYIKEEVLRLIKVSDSDVIGIDGAVIIGSPIEEMCEFIVAVVADSETRAKRIKERDSLTDAQVKQRLAAQPDDDFYIRAARYVIVNDGSESELRERVRRVYDEILKNRGI